VDAAVSYYGVGIHRSLEQGARITAPFLMHIAAQDHLCNSQAQQELHDAFAAKENFVLHTHAKVGHAFARPNSPLWDERAAGNANAITAEFLSRALGGS
jgi:carboxymethylenebutenolidase